MDYDAEAAISTKEQPITHRSQMGRELKKKIRDRSAKVGVVGLGYVGLPLALEMARAGFEVTGIDLVRDRVDSINSGISYIPDVTGEALFSAVSANRFRATHLFRRQRRSILLTFVCRPRCERTRIPICLMSLRQ